MDHRVQQGLAHRFHGVISLVFAQKPLKRGAGSIVKVDGLVSLVQLLKDRAAKFLSIFEQQFVGPLKDGQFDGMLALVRDQKS